MEWWKAILLGIVEGVTEYLPVSSTGHLLLAQRALGIGQSEAANAYAICIQAGAIVAVLELYFRRVRQIGRGICGKDEDGFRLGVNILTAFLPAVAAGLLLEKPIKHWLFAGSEWGLWPVVIAWFLGGIAILATVWIRRLRRRTVPKGCDLEALTWRAALIVGICQCLAMWPGVSRSLVTIVSGVLVGLSVQAAVEFSFLLGVVTLTAATAKDFISYGQEMLDAYGWPIILLGFAAAWLSAVAAVKWMVAYLQRHGLGIFGYYRIVLAIVVAILLLAGALP